MTSLKFDSLLALLPLTLLMVAVALWPKHVRLRGRILRELAEQITAFTVFVAAPIMLLLALFIGVAMAWEQLR